LLRLVKVDIRTLQFHDRGNVVDAQRGVGVSQHCVCLLTAPDRGPVLRREGEGNVWLALVAQNLNEEVVVVFLLATGFEVLLQGTMPVVIQPGLHQLDT
jgi:hypothetical protein